MRPSLSYGLWLRIQCPKLPHFFEQTHTQLTNHFAAATIPMAHLTLHFSALPLERYQAALQHLAPLLSNPLPLEGEMAVGEHYFEALFYRINITPALQALRSAAERYLGPSPTSFRPHVSLYYGDSPKTALQHLQAQQTYPVLKKLDFEADRLYLIQNDEINHRWTLLSS